MELLSAPDGTAIRYSYDDLGNLVGVRNVLEGEAVRYGYVEGNREQETGNSRLNLIAGDTGEAIAYFDTPQVLPVRDNLGTASEFVGDTVTGDASEESEDRYIFSFRESEIKSTATDFVYLGVDVTGVDSIPEIEGLTPVSTILGNDGAYELFGFPEETAPWEQGTGNSSSFALFAIAKSGLNLLSIDADSAYELELAIAGDVNGDGSVNGFDSRLLSDAVSNNAPYSRELDINRDGVIDGEDISILGSNYGFVTNKAPTISGTTALTHEDLSVEIPLADLGDDSEGDEVFYQALNPTNGEVRFAPDGETVVFVPTPGYSGTASFELVADDGFARSDAATIEVEVSDAPLTSLDFVERNPSLEVGEQFELQVVADFADESDVLLPGDYLSWSSDDESVARVDDGLAIALSDGTTIFSAERNGFTTVTASRVGRVASPTTETEINTALAEFYGLDVYPDAVTLTEGVERQIFVRVEGVAESPDLTDDATGTRYFVNNPDLISVNKDGLITTLAEGEASVTVINGSAESVIPVNVKTPNLGTTTLDETGGIVQNSDGYQVMIPEGALDEDVEIEITTLQKSELTTPLPEEFDIYNAFNLELGEESLATPAQLAIPAPEGLEAGTEVFFLRDDELPDETGTWNPIWFVQDSGIVGDDGMIRTSSPPWPAVQEGGNYTIAVPKFSYQVGQAFVGGGFSIDFSLFAGVAALSQGVAIGLDFSFGFSFGFSLPFFYTELVTSLDVITIPRIGTLPFVRTTNVEINPNGIPVAEVIVDVPSLATNNPYLPPVLEKGEIEFIDDPNELSGSVELGDFVVYLEGSNFLNESSASGLAGDSFDDLIPTFHYGGEKYEAQILPNLSNALGNNRYELAVEIPQTVVLGESSISLTRRQEEYVGINPATLDEFFLESENRIRIKSDKVEFTLAAQAFNDTVSVFNAFNPEGILNDPGTPRTSRDLLLARIPVGTGGDFDDSPRDLAATNDATRAYVSLEDSGSLALLDLMTFRQVDNNPATNNIFEPIPLPGVASPRAIAISPDDRYAYVADYRAGLLYIVDIDPLSEEYHQTVSTVSLIGANNGIHSLAISCDGKRLFATAPGSYSDTEGKIYVLNIDPEDEPEESEPNLNNWHEVIGAIDTDAGIGGVTTTPDPSFMLFANRRDESQGIGRIEITNNDPNSFAADVSYTPLGLGSSNDYFDVNEAFSITVTSDGQYAFVAGRNARLMGSGIPSIDAPKAGSNVGIIADPLTPNARLVAATRPIPNAWTSDVTITSDDRYLFAAYPGVGGVYAWDVEEIIETIDDPTVFTIDHLGRGVHSPIFLPSTSRNATVSDLETVPIDNINPDIAIASDLQLITESYVNNEFEFGVPNGSTRAPLTVGFNPWSVANANYRDWLDLSLIDGDNITEDSTPTFEWQFDSGFEDVEEVNIFVSSFPEDKGLLPWDELADLSDPDFLSSLTEEQKKDLLTRPWQEYDDFNPGRILTATWKKDTNSWYWHDGTTTIPQSTNSPQNNKNRFTLPDSLALTTGQTYYWAVEATGKPGTRNLDFGRFETIAPPSTDPFSSVSILTHGFTLLPSSTGIDSGTYSLAAAIADSQGNEPDEKGLILRYDKPTGLWIPVDEQQNVLDSVTGGLDTDDPDYLSTVASNIKADYQNKPLVLIPEWSLDYESVLPVSGFTEGAADAIFASMVQLDQALGGEIGISDPATGDLIQLYDNEGDLIRTHGDLFNSPLHFVGFSRGTVVNSEIIQRFGTYYPHAGGDVYIDSSDGNQVKPVEDASGNEIRDLQMTTIDPHDFQQNSLNVGLPLPGLGTVLDFKDFNEPSVTVWDNVTFADNYYQTVARETNTFTPNGREIDNADVNVKLDGRSGFNFDLGFGGTHTRVLTWYAGTVDLALDEVRTGYQIPPELRVDEIYDLLGEEALDSFEEEDISQLLDFSAANPALTAWYFKDEENNSEGIGEGWYYSVLGGGERPISSTINRVPVGIDNTDPDVIGGDFAVPTVFNGNFDYQLSNTPGGTISDNTPVPGWSFHHKEQKLKQSSLVRWSEIDPDDFALELNSGDIVTHNRFIVPDFAETFIFDLMVTEGSEDDLLEVYIEQEEDWLKLDEIELNLGTIEDSEEYDNEFETYNWEISQEFVGKVSSIQFRLIDSNNDNSNTTILLNNVSFTDKIEVINLDLMTGGANLIEPEDTLPIEESLILNSNFDTSSIEASTNENLDLLFNAPTTGTKTVEIKIDGEFDRFLDINYEFSDGSIPIDLSPAKDTYRFKLIAGGQDISFQAPAKSYDDMFFGSFPNGQPKKYQDLNHDRLYGAEFIVTEFTPDEDAVKIDTSSYLQYRWINVVDPESIIGRSVPLPSEVDDTALFHRTLADGEGNFVREKYIDIRVPRSFKTLFNYDSASNTDSEFQYSQPTSNRDIVKWTFDPVDANNQHNCYVLDGGIVELDVSCKIDNLNITANFRDGFKTDVGKLQVRGEATEPETLYLNTDGFQHELREMFNNGMLVNEDDYFDNKSLVGLIQNQNDLSEIQYRDKEKEEAIDLSSASRFKETFGNFLPANRITAEENNQLPNWAANLELILNQETTNLVTAVIEDFTPTKRGNISGYIISESAAPASSTTGNQMIWDYVVDKGGKPIDGSGTVDLIDFWLGKNTNPDIPVIDTNILENGDISKVAKEWSLATAINRKRYNNATIFTRVNPFNHFKWELPSMSFGGYVANTLSHELGHNFGLNESYKNKKPQTVSPSDIMRESSTLSSNLEFDIKNITLLQAALGFHVSPDSINRPDRPFFRFDQTGNPSNPAGNNALHMYMINWNLPTTENGLDTSSYLLNEEDI